MKGDGDVDLNATIKENWEAKLETCDQKFAEEVRCHAVVPYEDRKSVV